MQKVKPIIRVLRITQRNTEARAKDDKMGQIYCKGPPKFGGFFFLNKK
jgi:hypothetical protein